jgi:hypothetical protein
MAEPHTAGFWTARTGDQVFTAAELELGTGRERKSRGGQVELARRVTPARPPRQTAKFERPGG